MSHYPTCDKFCADMPECAVCRLRKKPSGRDAAAAAANGYCDSDCEGYDQEPRAGHLWPDEWQDELEQRKLEAGKAGG